VPRSTCVKAAQQTPTDLRRATSKQTASATRDRRALMVDRAPSVSWERTNKTAGTPTALSVRRIQTHLEAAAWSQTVRVTLDHLAPTVDLASSVSRTPTRLVVGMLTARPAQQILARLQVAPLSQCARATLDSRGLEGKRAQRASLERTKPGWECLLAIAVQRMPTHLRRALL